MKAAKVCVYCRGTGGHVPGCVDGSEAAFQAKVERFARLHGWLVMHVNDSRRPARRGGRIVWVGDEDTAGYPDCTFVHPRWGEHLVAELKTDRGRLTPAQRTWLDAFQAAGVEAHVWRPRDITEVEARLGQRRR